ncbi:MAG: hypothetical protein JXK93_10445 [Sphaerochaetaceae bacterium]|nr:hypothetical protein [Sphaerochaetaceae bacterium]
MLSFLTLLLILFISTVSVPEERSDISVQEGRATLPSLEKESSITALSGEWELVREGVNTFQKVPAVAWENGAGTYRITLEVSPEDAGIPVQLYTKNTGTSSELYVNGNLVGSQGVYAQDAAHAVPSARPVVYTFTLTEGENVLEFKVSNFTHPRAGLWERVVIAKAPILTHRLNRRLSIEFILIGVLAFIVVFISALALQLGEFNLFYFASAAASVALGSLLYNSYPIYQVVPGIDYILVKKGTFFFFYLSNGFIFKSIIHDIRPKEHDLFVQISHYFFLLLAILSVVLPYKSVYSLSVVASPLSVVVFTYFLFLQYSALFSYPSQRSFLWNVPRIMILSVALYGLIHDLVFYLSGQYQDTVLQVLSSIYSIGYALLIVRSLLENRKRLEEAKTLIISAADDTRNKIRADLHDRLGQLTHGMAYLVDSLKICGEQEGKTVDLLKETSTRINEELRHVIDNLGPSRLNSLGLQAAIEQMTQRSRDIFGITLLTDIHFDSIQGWNPVTEQIYLIVNEALTNAIRHASPDFIRIELTKNHGRFFLKMSNNGVKTSGTVFDKAKGHGIDIMRYRIEHLGGTFDAGSRTGGLFTITAEIPEVSV